MVVYGIKNCNTVKAALAWLQHAGIAFTFHDYKTKGISTNKLAEWCKQVGWENLLNRRGTTWRKLDPGSQKKVIDATSAIGLMIEKTSVIRRPLIEENGKVLAVGFDEEFYRKMFSC